MVKPGAPGQSRSLQHTRGAQSTSIGKRELDSALLSNIAKRTGDKKRGMRRAPFCAFCPQSRQPTDHRACSAHLNLQVWKELTPKRSRILQPFQEVDWLTSV